MSKVARTVLAIALSAVFGSCSASPERPASTSSASAAPSDAGLSIGDAGTTVHRESVGVAAIVRNSGTHGVRDIEISIDYFAGETLVLSAKDMLAFCPAKTECPWGTIFGATDNRHRSIDSAHVKIVRTGPMFDDGSMRPIALHREDESVSFEQPPAVRVVILYVLQHDAPIFGMFRTHQTVGRGTVRLTDELLPIGPGTRAVFYEGHIPPDKLAGGD